MLTNKLILNVIVKGIVENELLFPVVCYTCIDFFLCLNGEKKGL